MIPRDCWEGGVLRETQCRASDSVSNTSLTPTPHILNYKSDINLEIRIKATHRTGFIATVNTTGSRDTLQVVLIQWELKSS